MNHINKCAVGADPTIIRDDCANCKFLHDRTNHLVQVSVVHSAVGERIVERSVATLRNVELLRKVQVW
jgi:hypothetical protein